MIDAESAVKQGAEGFFIALAQQLIPALHQLFRRLMIPQRGAVDRQRYADAKQQKRPCNQKRKQPFPPPWGYRL